MMRHLIRLAVAAAVAGYFVLTAASTRAADPQAGIDAEVIYRGLYSGQKRQKALAIGAAGTWGYGYGYGSLAEAEKGALKSCLAAVRMRTWGKQAKCKIIARNGKLVAGTKFMGIDLDKPLPLPDIPLKRAAQFWPRTSNLQGIVLALHGCNGSGSGVAPFESGWFTFFQARGFLVVYPSSFDEGRPPEFCGIQTPEHYQAATEAVKFRVAQTKRTIGELRKTHPNVPIYLWAHSEGGYVAQALDMKLAGMIIVGTICGFGDAQNILVPKSVPILHVFGEADDTILGMFDEKILTQHLMTRSCGPAKRGKTRRWVIAKDADHLTSIWRQNVIDAASWLIGQKSFNLAETNEPIALEGEARTAYEQTYQEAGAINRKSAFAIGPGGAYGFAAGEDGEDTRQYALYRCAQMVDFKSQKSPYPPGGRQPCRVYAVGDKIVAR